MKTVYPATPNAPCDTVMQKDIFRLAALLYTETNNQFSTIDVQQHIVMCIIAENGNDPQTTEEILSKIAESYKYHLSAEELMQIIDKSRRTFASVIVDGEKAYSLTPTKYEEVQKSLKNNIDSHIDRFISKFCIEDGIGCKDAVHKFLYELTTSNINSYRVLFSERSSNSFAEDDLSVNAQNLSEQERQLVHHFLSWDDAEKNVALGNIVYCCLEYCLLVNGDKPTSLVSRVIRKRDIYLDTNIVFRALGINGSARKNVTIAFLKKCKQAKLNLIITGTTEKEFFDTTRHYIEQISRYPHSQVFAGAYALLSDYNMFSYYDEWAQAHSSLSLHYFSAYIKAEYESLVREYGISHEDIPKTLCNSEEFKRTQESYAKEILLKKQHVRTYYQQENLNPPHTTHDATVVHYIETRREECADEKDVFFVSSDKNLRYWDMTRDTATCPIVIYPSQLFLILIKMCGRSENDFESFVSFINIRVQSQQLTPEKANIIIAGISMITEDIKSQEQLVASVFDNAFQDVIQHSTTDMDLYVNTQVYCQKYLEQELKDRDTEIAEMTAREKEAKKTAQCAQEELVRSRLQAESTIHEQAAELERRRSQTCIFAEKQIKCKFLFSIWGIPVILSLAALACFAFMLLQFIFSNEPWNFAVRFYDWLKTTWFGQRVGDYVHVIDAAIIGALIAAFKKWMKNPFDTVRVSKKKADMVQAYIKKHHLG